MTRHLKVRYASAALAGLLSGVGRAPRLQDVPPTPALFGESVISTPANELNSAFSPDGRAVCFTKAAGDGGRFGVIVTSRLVAGRWTAPRVAAFSGRYSDYDPFVSPDGARLFFVSNRSAPGADTANFDIWYVDRRGDGWTEPAPLGPPVNSERDEFYPSVAANGTLYFASCGRPDGRGSCDVYRSRLVDGAHRAVENLGDSINSAAVEVDSYIAPDERYLVLTAYGRPDELGGGDLYVAYHHAGVWSRPRRLDPPVNSTARDYCPIVSPDGRHLFFTSQRGFADVPLARTLTSAELRDSLASVRNGFGNVYQVGVSALGEKR